MTYQWQRCIADGCADIGGASDRFYTVQSADAGSRLRAMETMAKLRLRCAGTTPTGTQECH